MLTFAGAVFVPIIAPGSGVMAPALRPGFSRPH